MLNLTTPAMVFSTENELICSPFKVGTRFLQKHLGLQPTNVFFQSELFFVINKKYYETPDNLALIQQNDVEIDLKNYLQGKLNKTIVLFYRNPIDRFKSGIIQELQEQNYLHQRLTPFYRNYLKNDKGIKLLGSGDVDMFNDVEFVNKYQTNITEVSLEVIKLGLLSPLNRTNHTAPYHHIYKDIKKFHSGETKLIEIKEMNKYFDIESSNSNEWSNKHLLDWYDTLKIDTLEYTKDELKIYNEFITNT